MELFLKERLECLNKEKSNLSKAIENKQIEKRINKIVGQIELIQEMLLLKI